MSGGIKEIETNGIDARVVSVDDDKQLGLVAQVAANGVGEPVIETVLGNYVRPWAIIK